VHIPLLDEIALICALGVFTTVILSRLQLPTVTGLLLAGAMLGPHALGLAHSIEAIQVLAELGVVFLLFTIGLEFSLARLKTIFKQVAVGGISQVALTTAAVAVVARLLGTSWSLGVFYGFVFALSSTAIVMRGLAERRETDAPHGRFIVGTLIFQDLCVVPMVLVVPYLAPRGDDSGDAAWLIATAIGRAAVVVVVTVTVARLVVPWVLRSVDASRSREAFLLAVLALCIGTAWLTSLVGLSLALGAFLGGMVVADSEFGHRAMGDMLPLRDVFVSIFFVSLGMLFDFSAVLEEPGLFALFFAGFIFLKGALATIAATTMRFPARVAWLAGVGLAQFGEFGFVLTSLGITTGVVDEKAMAPLLAAGIGSMVLTPIMVRIAPHVTAGERLIAPVARLLGARTIDDADEHATQTASGHVVIIGYGLAGRLVARALTSSGFSTIALEMNAERVRQARAEGEPVFYADATSEEALGHAHIDRARAIIVLINDPQAAERVIMTTRRVTKEVPIFLRAHYLSEAPALLRYGKIDIVAEELEGGVEVLARVLKSIGVPRNTIDKRITEVRRETQSSARRLTMQRHALSAEGPLADLKIECIALDDGSQGIGKTLRELELRARTGALVVAIVRKKKVLENPSPTLPLERGDVIYLVGRGTAVRAATEMLTTGEPAPETQLIDADTPSPP
jgi:CPA2 family monovalent cation:H+ antiporter-2